MNEDWKCAVLKCPNITDKIALIEIKGYHFIIKQFMCYTHIGRMRYSHGYGNIIVLAEQWPRQK